MPTGGPRQTCLVPTPDPAQPLHLDLATLRAAAAVAAEAVPRTPAYEWPLLSALAAAEVWVKHENQTPTGAFKVRGGLVYVDRLRRERPQVRGIVSATRGNHGQSLAYAGARAGLRVLIVVPEGNSPEKNASMAAFGAELVVHGRDFQEALQYATELAAAENLEPVPAFHPDLVAGVAGYALELFDQAPALHRVYVPVGMGSGICGLIAARDALGLDTEIVGVVTEQASATALSFRAGRVVSTANAATFVDGVACRTPDPVAVATIVAGAADVLTISEGAAAEAMRVLLTTTHQLPEPAGALGLAGLLADRAAIRGRRVATVISGGNCDGPLLAEVLAGRTPRPS